MKRVLHSKSRRQTRVLITTIVAVMFVALIVTPTVSARPYAQTPTSIYSDYMRVWIYDAYYGDLDQGGCQNDIHVILLFELGYYPFYEVYYDITLTLPSGQSFTYTIYFLADYEYIRIDNVFLNYATESGDYRIDITALMITPSLIIDTQSCIFDPPGSIGGGDPSFQVY